MTEPFPWTWILAICGIITSIGVATSWVMKLFGPFKKMKAEIAQNEKVLEQHNKELELLKSLMENDRQMKEMLEQHQKDLELHDRLLKQDNEHFKSNDACMTAILKSIYALLEHARTNNSTGLMDAASNELQQFLIERK